jgi:pimeloyl-ACP methyl ester carboxylesterase
MGMNEIKHSSVEANRIRIHTAECGTGPLVILVHGFPESWYSWRYQLPVLADAGYRAVAIDVRGYGRSSKPAAVEDYRMVKLVGDIVGLVSALGESQATLIGHDWGAPIVWHSALLRPDLFRGVAGLSVPYSAPGGGPLKPTAGMRAMAGADQEFYIEYFQQPGRAEAEIEKDVRSWLLGFYHCASGDVENGPNISMVGNGTELREKFVFPDEMPDWLTDADLDYYAGEFEHAGFTGGLNRYRNVDRDWEDLTAYSNQPIEIPALFVGGEKDGPTMWGGAAIAKFPETLPKLHDSIIVKGSGHWIQQEYADDTNRALLDFLSAIH